MRPGRLAADVDAFRVGPEAHGIRVNPGDRTADLVGNREQTAADILYPGEIGGHVMHPATHKHFSRGMVEGRLAPDPGAAMDEDENRRRRGCPGPEDIEPLDLGWGVGDALR